MELFSRSPLTPPTVPFGSERLLKKFTSIPPDSGGLPLFDRRRFIRVVSDRARKFSRVKEPIVAQLRCLHSVDFRHPFINFHTVDCSEHIGLARSVFESDERKRG